MLTKTPTISRNVLKLLAITGIVFFALVVLPLLFCNYVLHLPEYVGAGVALVPFISITICIIRNGGFSDVGGKITGIKYNTRFPLFFHFDADPPKKYRFKEIDQITRIIQPGDVLLRRHDHYIDGLILSQTTYFTHAAIYYGKVGEKENQVIHAVGKTGVSWVDLDKFARCDDIAILRFEIDPRMQQDEIRRPGSTSMSFVAEHRKRAVKKLPDIIPEGRGSVLSNEIVRAFDVRSFIADVVADKSSIISQIGNREITLFDSLKSDLSTDGRLATIPPREEYVTLVLDMANALLGKQYDFEFNFVDFKRLSCVEFVWYCYKSLFPLHQIRRKFFSYFNWVHTLVMVPDLFLKTQFFKLYYSSVHVENKKGRPDSRLRTFVKRRLLHFWVFLGKMVLCQLLLLLIVWALFRMFWPGAIFHLPATQ
ncbi:MULTISPECIES: YiiX/YebB-like N1pC/P60 family cysteine hydrolase [Niastella]|uniref:NlpC/P60 domain-containing protein n=1 Tax=Niastella soli TaxID=2821487 RepID=A0ABS3Z2P0_9BACT|nr:YiiX/YebB-like N1pC/P60 family cysteine hydrolase [Niastella soli]MBO9204395.1 hypothetical protein [Niastella soli]